MASSGYSSNSSNNSPCAACKFLRRKCMPDCIFAPYFPPEEPHKFANVHKIFGASNVSKILNEVLPHQREDAVNSLAYEAEARIKDPVYGCVGAISVLQRQVIRLQKELDATHADLIRYTTTTTTTCINCTNNNIETLPSTQHHQAAAAGRLMNIVGGEGEGNSSSTLVGHVITPAFYYPSRTNWSNDSCDGDAYHRSGDN